MLMVTFPLWGVGSVRPGAFEPSQCSGGTMGPAWGQAPLFEGHSRGSLRAKEVAVPLWGSDKFGRALEPSQCSWGTGACLG